jgi:bifunctional DNA-binding transcriptional regulator/antitoxin component of YhaV-PrlF toxin-antitoxin module
MVKSTLTSKNRTTVPKVVRERLGVGRGDVLVWEVDEGGVRVTAATIAFLQRRGSVRVGRGSVADDISEARRRRNHLEPYPGARSSSSRRFPKGSST